MRKILIALIIFALFVGNASASDYDVYKSIWTEAGCSEYFTECKGVALMETLKYNEFGRKGDVEYLLTAYTNHYDIKELISKMEWLNNHEIR